MERGPCCCRGARLPPAGPGCCASLAPTEAERGAAAAPGYPGPGCPCRRSCCRCCIDSGGLHGPAGFQCAPTRAAPKLYRNLTWCRDHSSPSIPAAGPGLPCMGVFMIYVIFDFIFILSHPVRCAPCPRPPAPGVPPRSGRGRTPLFGFKRSSGRGRARPADPGSGGSRLLRLPAPPWWCRRGG